MLLSVSHELVNKTVLVDWRDKKEFGKPLEGPFVNRMVDKVKVVGIYENSDGILVGKGKGFGIFYLTRVVSVV